MTGKPQNTSQTFWSRVHRDGPHGCWEYSGKPNKNGYCEFGLDGKRHYAHRTAYALTFPEWDGTGHVLHHCDNRRCVNPLHLFNGSDADNVADMVAKGRARGAPRGLLHPDAKLTPEDVAEIRASPMGCRRLARKYGVTRAHIQGIRTGRKWRHVAPGAPATP
jgi:hypothetical protein